MHFKTVLAHLKWKIFSVGQPWWPKFFHIETGWTHIFVLSPPFGKFVSHFCTTAYLFNDVFASICTPINNGSTMPPFAYKTNVRINSLRINHNDISLIIKNIDLNKAHGCDNISIKMIQICGESIALPKHHWKRKNFLTYGN